MRKAELAGGSVLRISTAVGKTDSWLDLNQVNDNASHLNSQHFDNF
jgi:hypothetical protein